MIEAQLCVLLLLLDLISSVIIFVLSDNLSDLLVRVWELYYQCPFL